MNEQLKKVMDENLELAAKVRELQIPIGIGSFAPAYGYREKLVEICDQREIPWESIFSSDFTLPDKELEESILNLLLLFEIELNKCYKAMLP